jgi:hypothetical protein
MAWKNLKYFFAIFLLASCSAVAQAQEFKLDPNIITVSSGPIKWINGSTGARFRTIVILNEVYLSLFIQKIEYGEETCCARISKTFQIDPQKVEGPYKLHHVADIKWLSYESFEFKGNSTNYIVSNLDTTYEVRPH